MIVTGVEMVVPFRCDATGNDPAIGTAFHCQNGTLFHELSSWNSVPALLDWNDVPSVSEWMDGNQYAASGAARGTSVPGAHRRCGGRASRRLGQERAHVPRAGRTP